MFLSELENADIKQLTSGQKTDIVFRQSVCPRVRYDAALLLGTEPNGAKRRAAMAASFFKRFEVNFIIASGGVRHEYEGKKLTEADIMYSVLAAQGVPESVIVPENQARSTMENLLFGTVELGRRKTMECIERVVVITEPFHLRRALLLARTFLPRYFKVYGYTEGFAVQRRDWPTDSALCECVHTEIRCLKKMIENHNIADIRF